MLIKKQNYKRIRSTITSLPTIKQYIQFLKFLQKKVKLQFISKSNLIQKKPNENYVKLCHSQPCYLYLPWIENLTNKLIHHLDNRASDFRLIPLPIFTNVSTIENRQKIIFFTQHNHQKLKEILLSWLRPVAHHIKGVIFTFDYGLLQRQIIRVCQELKIPTILIPHESAFFNKEKYYFHPTTGINSPLCDYVLCWGQLQREIFINRGYPAKRIQTTGAPKLDAYYNYQPQFTHHEFCKRAKLSNDKKIIVFAAQTLDFQVPHQLALGLQQTIIHELIDYCQERDCEFILRCPPTGYEVLTNQIRMHLKKAHFFIDAPNPQYCFTPEETIYHADILLSINSTMLFEALLMGKHSLSVKYIEFEDWQQAGVTCVFSREQLIETLDNWIKNEHAEKIKPTNWAIESFSLNGFDGQATKRIIEFLKSTAIYPLTPISLPLQRLIHNEKPAIDLIYFPDLNSPFHYIPKLLNAKKIIKGHNKNLENWVEIDCQVKQKRSLKLLKQIPKVYIERGIIHFGCDWTSIILDDLTYYDEADKTTRLQTILESNVELTNPQEIEAQQCIDKLLDSCLSVKNTLKLEQIGRPGKLKILLIDEPQDTLNIMVEIGFKNMLIEAINHYSDCDILIKPPEKAKKTYLMDELKQHDNIFILPLSYSVYDLFPYVEEIFVVNSLIGFFGLMTNKIVHCYGSPFYANWGLTKDKLNLVRRKRKRNLQELFYFSCIYLSRYYSTTLERQCSLNEYISFEGNELTY